MQHMYTHTNTFYKDPLDGLTEKSKAYQDANPVLNKLKLSSRGHLRLCLKNVYIETIYVKTNEGKP